jgi:predicted Zn finger-like uncharacterized protein
MFTRCPNCKTVHPLNASLIAYARGSVRCGHCTKTFDALAILFDQWPSGRAHGPTSGSDTGPPVIGRSRQTPTPQDTDAAENTDNTELQKNPHNLAWGLLAALLILITAANTGWTFREPLLHEPKVQAWLTQHGWLKVEPPGLLKSPDQIQLVSRDMHTHPTRTGILVLSLTFVNLAQTTQDFPLIEVTLLDVTSQVVARRRFQPRHYLRADADESSGLAADVFLPVLLELGDAGQKAVGFEIQFL